MSKPQKLHFPLILGLMLLAFPLLSPAQVPLNNGHAHNDYEHRKPLTEALGNGFRSLEIDVFLHQGELIVSHVPLALKVKPTLQELYLDPLKERIEKNQGFVFPGDSTSLILYIDFKTGSGTYEKLQEVLQPYFPYLKLWYGDSLKWGPVEILIDGHVEKVMQARPRFTCVQLGWDQFDAPYPATLVTRLNGNYRSLFSWRGFGQMPEAEKEKLRKIYDNAHQYGRSVRLYACGNKKQVWQEMWEAGADWVNADKLKRYQNLYQARSRASKP